MSVRYSRRSRSVIRVTGKWNIAGPDTHDFVDMARRTLEARGRKIILVPTWRGPFDTTMAGEPAGADEHSKLVLCSASPAWLGSNSPEEDAPAGGVKLAALPAGSSRH